MKVEELLKLNKSVTFLFIGDSITHGLNYCTSEETYVACFAAMLAAHFPGTQVIRYDGIVKNEQSPLQGYEKTTVQEGSEGCIHVIRSGVGGNTVLRAINRKKDFTGILPSGTHADHIFTMFGINDALKSDPDKYVTPQVFSEQYGKLLSLLQDDAPQAQTVIMTATTNDQPIEAHIQATYALAEKRHIPIVDLYRLWRDHHCDGMEHYGHGDWLQGDACHPTPKAAQAMAQEILNYVLEE